MRYVLIAIGVPLAVLGLLGLFGPNYHYHTPAALTLLAGAILIGFGGLAVDLVNAGRSPDDERGPS